MNLTEADALLGIGPEVDAREAKRAYLRAVKRHPPEHDPEGFRQVRAAWELVQARRYDDQGSRSARLPRLDPQGDAPPPPTVAEVTPRTPPESAPPNEQPSDAAAMVDHLTADAEVGSSPVEAIPEIMGLYEAERLAEADRRVEALDAWLASRGGSAGAVDPSQRVSWLLLSELYALRHVMKDRQRQEFAARIARGDFAGGTDLVTYGFTVMSPRRRMAFQIKLQEHAPALAGALAVAPGRAPPASPDAGLRLVVRILFVVGLVVLPWLGRVGGLERPVTRTGLASVMTEEHDEVRDELLAVAAEVGPGPDRAFAQGCADACRWLHAHRIPECAAVHTLLDAALRNDCDEVHEVWRRLALLLGDGPVLTMTTLVERRCPQGGP